MDAKKMAENLVKLRGNRTQKEVCEKTGIKPSTYSMYELGLRIPSDKNKVVLANYFKKSVQSIFFN